MARKDEKQFSFKQIETQMLQTIHEQGNLALEQNRVALSNFVSYVLMDRLQHKVTPDTKFELTPDFQTVVVWQDETEPEKPAEPTVKLKGKK
jgi:hypothetical protein